ncbi:hypothetical protein ABH941_001051, partial [Streptacidiphilus sp. EB103A]
GKSACVTSLQPADLHLQPDRDSRAPELRGTQACGRPASGGVIEVLGAIGLILPPLSGIAPWLALAAAIGFVVLQLGATRVQLRRGDHQVALNLTLLLAASVTTCLATTWL